MEEIDMNYFNSPTQLEEQMDLMTVLMQMEQLPEFSDLSSPSFEYSNGTSPSLYSPPLSSSSTLPCPSSPISLPKAAIQDPLPLPTNSSFTAELSYPYLDPMAAARDMMYRAAAMQAVDVDPGMVKPTKRRNVRVSKEPQSVAARHRRERISERIRVLQRLVPGGTKMDTASMLDEAVHYVKFLKAQVQMLERAAANWSSEGFGFGFGFHSAMEISSGNNSCMGRTCQLSDQHQVLFDPMQMLS